MPETKHGFANQTISDETNLEVTLVDIAEGGLAGIADLLNGLYQDGPFAIFREYVSNAYDSHVKAGTLGIEPIRITISDDYRNHRTFTTWEEKTLPGFDTFSVEDRGTGMSHEELKNVYAKYGGSTKTGDKTTIGHKGVGAKSALSVSGYFEVVSVKAGEKITAVIEKDANSGLSHMLTKKIEKTDERNGVKVSIPVNRNFYHDISKRLTDYFNAWGKGTVLINGSAPAGLNQFNDDKSFLKIYNEEGTVAGWVQIKTNSGEQSFNEYNSPNVYMGGVPYQINSFHSYFSNDTPALYALYKQHYKTIFNMPLDSLELTPNREQVKTTTANSDKITSTIREVDKLVRTSALMYLNSLPEKEAIMFWSYNIALFQTGTNELVEPTYRGKPLRSAVRFGDYYTAEEVKTYNAKRFRLDTPVSLPNYNTGRFIKDADRYFSLSHMGLKAEGVVVWGKYAGRAKDPFATHGKNALKQTGNVKIEEFSVIHLNVDEEPPAEILNSFNVFTMDEFLELAKMWRAENYAVATPRAPRTNYKTVSNSLYVHLHLNEEGEVVAQVWDKKDVKNAEETFYYLPEEFYNKRNYITSRNDYSWNSDKDKFKDIEPTLDIPYPFREIQVLVKTFKKPLLLVPHKKSLNVIAEAAGEKAVPFVSLVEQEWAKVDSVTQLQIAICSYHLSSYLPRHFEPLVDRIENTIVREVFEALRTTDAGSLLIQLAIAYMKPRTDVKLNDVPGFKLYYKYLHELSDRPSIEMFNKMLELTDI